MHGRTFCLLRGVPVGWLAFVGLFLLFETVSSSVLAFFGAMSIPLLLFGLLLWGLLYLNLFVLKRPLGDFMNWYLAYYFLYFYIGYWRNSVDPMGFATFAASRISLDPDMLQLSIIFTGIYVSIVFGLYSILSKGLRVSFPLVRSSNGFWLRITFWALSVVDGYLLSLGFLRMGSVSQSNSLMNIIGTLINLIPILSAYLFFTSGSRWRFAYPAVVCLLSIMAASKAAILKVILIYITFYLVQGRFTIRRLPPITKMFKAAMIIAGAIWITSVVVYPLVLSYRTSGRLLEAYAAVATGQRHGFISDLIARIQGADNFTLLVQSVYDLNEPHVSYFDTINVFNYLLPRSIYPNKPAHTIANLYTSRIAGYRGDYSFAVLVTDIGEAFYYFGIGGVFLVAALMGVVYSLGSRIAGRVRTDRDVLYYVLLISSLANPAEMFLEYKVYSFLVGYVLLRGLFSVADGLRIRREKRIAFQALS